MGYVDTLRELTDEAGVLLMVEEIRFEEPPRMIVGLVLRFEKRTLWISANPDNDTIVLGREPFLPETACRTVTIIDPVPWEDVYGSACRWAWLLVNQQGYEDGIRLQFATSPALTCIELIVAASTINVCRFQANF